MAVGFSLRTAICSLTALLSVVCDPVAALEASAPAYAAGDTWVYREIDLLTKNETAKITERVQSIDAGAFWLLVDAGRQRIWWRGDSVKAVRLEQFEFSDGANEQRGKSIGTNDGGAAMPWPLKVGDKFDRVENATFPNGWKLRYELTYKVEAVETIEVGAGRFETLRILGSGFYTNQTTNSNGRHERTLWYAPAAKREVRSEIRTWLRQNTPYRVEGRELMEFKPGAAR